VTIGSVEPLKQLYARWGDALHFLDVVIRQAHPGPGVREYRTLDEKIRDAVRYQEEERIPWIILVDDLEGTVHRTYGELADPTYLIDRDGRVSFYNLWTSAPALHEAIEALLAQEGRGVVAGGIERRPHLLPALTDGWRGLRRGLPQSAIDLETASPGAAGLTWLGHQFRPLLAPLALRAQPLPAAARAGLILGAGALVWLVAQARQRKTH
jgi:hypothetical protein